MPSSPRLRTPLVKSPPVRPRPWRYVRSSTSLVAPHRKRVAEIWAAAVGFALAFGTTFVEPWVASASQAAPTGNENAASVGEGAGTVVSFQQEGGCDLLHLNADGTYENGYSWQFQGVVAPYYGAFGECYDTPAPVCGVTLDFTQIGYQSGQVMDVYIWSDAGGEPGAVAAVRTGVDPGPVAFWPALSRHAVTVVDSAPAARSWVGYWGAWPGADAGWFVGSDLDGPGGCPVTNVAPGIGYPTGWQDVSIVWGPAQALGIGVLFGEGPESGACCLPDGLCEVLDAVECLVRGGGFRADVPCEPHPCAEALGACCFADGGCRLTAEPSCIGSFLGAGTSCDPDPCPVTDGACCSSDGSCTVGTPIACAVESGVFLGTGTNCDPNPCPIPETGSCCFPDAICVLLTETQCAIDGGDFLGTSCDPNPCPARVLGACCLSLGTCEVLDDVDCAVQGGAYQGPLTTCAPNPCPTPCVPFALAGRESATRPAPTHEPFSAGRSGGEPGPNRHGVLVLHADPAVVYTDGVEYCGASLIDDCAEIVARSDSETPAVVHALAVFPEDAPPRLRGITFGLDFPDCVVLLDWQACGDFEVADGDWPAPGTGTAVTWGTTQTDLVVPVYWFAAYGLPTEPGELALAAHPSQGALFADDSVPARLDPIVALGSFGFYRAGTAPCPVGPDPVGACCFPDGACILETAAGCEAAGGELIEIGVSCDPNRCPAPVGACCLPSDGACIEISAEACLQVGGTFVGPDVACATEPCVSIEVGACCFVTGECLAVTASDCAIAGGAFQGANTLCSPDPCPAWGACCDRDGFCMLTAPIDCQSGTFLGEGVPCDPNPCVPAYGACCLVLGECGIFYDEDCGAAGGEFQGGGSTCTPNPCPPPCTPFALDGRASASRPAPPRDPFVDGTLAARPGDPIADGTLSARAHGPLADGRRGGVIGANFGGTLVLHHDPAVVYTGDGFPGDCGDVGSCDDVLARSDEEVPVVISAIALFAVDSAPRLVGITFGIDYPDCVQLLEWETCGDFEVSDGSWPAPGSGTAVTWMAPMTSRAVPVYRFAAQGYAQEPGEFALRAHPTQGALFADDSVPAILDPIAGLGSFGFFRNGVTPCPGTGNPEGACCFADGSCQFLTLAECGSLDGVLVGQDLPCNPNPCDPPMSGACCLPNGDCSFVAEFECAELGGNYQGDEVACDPNPCPQPGAGACCFVGGSCTLILEEDCEDGTFLGEDIPCDPNPCVPEFGACCFPDGGCTFRVSWECAGDFQGEGTSCAPNPCPPPALGACCLADGSCVVVTAFDCAVASGSFSEGGACTPNPCPQPNLGACCLPGGDCHVVDAIICAAAEGAFLGSGTECAPNPCPEPLPGACCLVLGVCELSDDVACEVAGGEFQGGGSTCEPNPCPPPCTPFALNGRASATRPMPPRDPFVDGTQRGGTFGANFGGTLVLHQDPSIVYTGDGFPGDCGDVGSCDEVLARSDEEVPVVISAIALFPLDSAPRLVGITFGIDYPDCVQLLEWEACGDFELSDGSWPAPGSGTAVTWIAPMTSRAVPVYRFAARGYALEPGEFALRSHPTQGALFADDSVPAILDPIAGLGSFGFFRNGVTPCPDNVGPVGACCFEDGSCQVLRFTQCATLGGAFYGQGVSCDPNPCLDAPVGACCLPGDGSCLVVTEYACDVTLGVFVGEGTDCTPNPCASPLSGACCFSDGSCVFVLPSDCSAAGGNYRGNGVACDPDPCPVTGACCFENGVCVVLYRTQCNASGGVFQGEDLPCDPGLCWSIGACCFADGSCRVLYEAICTSDGGTYTTDGSDCSPNPCPQPPKGACCLDNGSCRFVEEPDCGDLDGTYQGDGVSCSPNPCPQPPPGACCFADGSCQFLTPLQCEQADGHFEGSGVECLPDTCYGQVCCLDDQCFAVYVNCEDLGGILVPGSSCEPSPCPVTGACCFEDESCQVLLEGECAAQEGSFLGFGRDCEPNPCQTVPAVEASWGRIKEFFRALSRER